MVLSLGAQVVEAEPSLIGWIAAAIPALGFLVMVKIALASSVAAIDQADQSPDAQPIDWLSTAEPANASDGVGDVDALAEILVPAARAAAAALRVQRRRVTAKALGDVLRADRYGVSNAEASALLEELRPANSRSGCQICFTAGCFSEISGPAGTVTS